MVRMLDVSHPWPRPRPTVNALDYPGVDEERERSSM